MRDFAGKCAVITGGGSGIGAALARRAAAAGMNVVIADIMLGEAAAIATELGGDRALTVPCDVSRADSVEALAVAARARFGPVHLLCNNAGIVPGGRHRKVWEYSPSDWEWSLGVNLHGVINGIRAFVPGMIASGIQAHILNTASVAGFVSGSGSACYGAAKHAMVRVTEALYAGLKETSAPIGVTMLCPGLVRTKIYEAERNRPAHLSDASADISESAELEGMRDEILTNAVAPDDVADMAFEAIAAEQFYVFTTTSFDAAIAARAEAILARSNPVFESIVGMSRKDAGRGGAVDKVG